MRDYDLIAVGTGSALNVVGPFLEQNPDAEVAVIDKDEPGGICLTRGCVPTKLMTHAADVVRVVEGAPRFGIHARIEFIDFGAVMERMRRHVHPKVRQIRAGLRRAKRIAYFEEPARFVAPHVLSVGRRRIRGERILVCAGSRPAIPDVKGLGSVPYHTSDTILGLRERPEHLVIMGGGYIAAEFAHFFSAMGSRVTVVGRNPWLLPDEDTEVSDLAARLLSRHAEVLTGHEVVRVKASDGHIRLTAVRNGNGASREVEGDGLLVATGRASNSDVLRPDKGGIETDRDGWIRVNEFLETTQDRVWAFGDCIGRFQFKHVANQESEVVYRNAILGERARMDYGAVPRAVFMHPEIAAVGMTEAQALEAVGPQRLRVGRYRFKDVAKGGALGSKDEFIKVLIDASTGRILGAHIIGPQASVLVQEITVAMNGPGGRIGPLLRAMHIHPALPEVVQRAFGALEPVFVPGDGDGAKPSRTPPEEGTKTRAAMPPGSRPRRRRS